MRLPRHPGFEARQLIRFRRPPVQGQPARGDKPGHDNVESRVLTGETAIVIDNKVAVAQFIDELAGAKKLYLRVRSLNLGRTTAEYPLDGSAAAMQAALAGCPIQAAKPVKKRRP